MELFDVLLASALNGKSSGGSAADLSKPVNFFDYDGTVIKSYSKEEFLALSAMPANPSHEGLTAQGWNWTLADAQDYVRDNGPLDIGQMYVASDRKTRVKIELSEAELRITAYFASYAGGETIDIDWGDGNVDHVVTSVGVMSKEHTYQQPGSYIIAFDATSGVALNNIVDRRAAVKEIFLGDKLGIGQGFAQDFTNLRKINIPSLSSISLMPLYSFANTVSLDTVVIPDRVTYFAIGALGCNMYRHVILPKSFAPTSFSFGDRYLLKRIYIPESVTELGGYAFRLCANLKELVIPSGVTTIGIDAFRYCYSMQWIKFKSSTPATIGNSSAFQGVPTSCIIYVPQGSLEDYLDATNYPDPDVYTYIEY